MHLHISVFFFHADLVHCVHCDHSMWPGPWAKAWAGGPNIISAKKCDFKIETVKGLRRQHSMSMFAASQNNVCGGPHWHCVGGHIDGQW